MIRSLHIAFVLLGTSLFTLGQNAESQLHSGIALYDDLEFESAKDAFQSARDIDAQDARAAFNLGNSYFRLNEYALAVQQFEAVTSLSKDGMLQSRAFFNKGDALFELKNYVESVEAFKEALRRDPGNEQARYNLAYAQKFKNLPVAVCLDTVLYLDEHGTARIEGRQLDNGSTDNGTIVSYEASPAVFSCENLGVNLVKLIVTDEEGNKGSCHSRITVLDVLRPIARCKTDTIRLDSMGVAHVQAERLDGGSVDNCSIGTRRASPAQFTELGQHWVNFVVADSSGNSDSCRVMIVVEEFDPEQDKKEEKEEKKKQEEEKKKEEKEKEKQENEEKQEKEDEQKDKGKDGDGKDEGEDGKDGEDSKDGEDGKEGDNGQGGKNGEQQESAPQGLSKAQAQQLLESLEQDEKGVQKKVQRAYFGKKSSRTKTEKDW